MSATTADSLVSDYLERLGRAAAALPPDRRQELLEEIGEHISAARAAGSAADEAAVRTLLDRLGEPEEIVAAAQEDGAAGLPLWRPQAVVTRAPGTGLETAAVLMLTVGSFLPVIGWLVGVVLLWVSRRWTVAEKLLGTLVVPFGPGGVLMLGGLVGGQTCSVSMSAGGTVQETCTGFALPSWLGLPLLLVALVAPFVVAVVLLRRARARAALEPPLVRPAGTRSPWGGLEISAVVLLGVGPFVLPILAPIVGLILAWSSDQWTLREKRIATVLTVLPALLLVVLTVTVLVLRSAT